jgi:hypothetical protein
MYGPAVPEIFVVPAHAGRITALNINSLNEKYKPLVRLRDFADIPDADGL